MSWELIENPVANTERESLLPGNPKRRDLTWYLGYVVWNVPIFLYRFFALQFIQITVSKLSKLLPKRLRNENFYDIVGMIIMRMLQITILVVFFLQVLFQTILFAADETLINGNCCNTSFNDGTIEEIIFASDIIISLVSLGSCYFIFANSNIFEEKNISFRVIVAPLDNTKLSFPDCKGQLFSQLAILFTYVIIITLPLIMSWGFVANLYGFSSVNTYLEILLEGETCGTSFTPLRHSVSQCTGVFCVYLYLTYAITQYWHISPVFACIAVRYICVGLQHKVDIAVNKSKMCIKDLDRGRSKERPIVTFYKLIKCDIKEYSRRLYYIATLNIISVVIILGLLLSSYVDSSNHGFTEKIALIAENDKDINQAIAYRSPLIYLYHFFSVWLMSDAIITLNAKLEKFSDSVLKEDGITDILAYGCEPFKQQMRQQLSLISNSRERFEIALFGDFSLSVFYTIIPFGVGAMINFSVRAIDAWTSQMCNATN